MLSKDFLRTASGACIRRSLKVRARGFPSAGSGRGLQSASRGRSQIPSTTSRGRSQIPSTTSRGRSPVPSTASRGLSQVPGGVPRTAPIPSARVRERFVAVAPQKGPSGKSVWQGSRLLWCVVEMRGSDKCAKLGVSCGLQIVLLAAKRFSP